MVELRKEWKRAQLDLERSLGMRRRSSRWQKMRPLLLVVGVLSAATLVWSWSGRLRSLPPGADPHVVGVRGGSKREAPGPQGTNRPPEVSLRGLRKQGSIKMGHLDFLAEAEGVHDVESALDKLNNRFDDIPVLQQPLAMLKWASNTLPEGKWAQVTSFGLSGLTILDMAAKSGVLEKMPVITIDTLHLFPETYKLIENVKDFYDTQQIKSYRHKHTATLEEFNLKYGDKLFKGDPTLYDFVTKIEPMKRALDELHAVAWITGRRKSQGGERVFLKLFEVDPADGRLKLNPVANWVSSCVCTASLRVCVYVLC
jgi:phosphoadenylyl-sulfate reductase (thioredoxin)